MREAAIGSELRIPIGGRPFAPIPAAGNGGPRPGHSVVAIGGGTGLPVVLRALRLTGIPRLSVSAIVTVSDDGGSSGRLSEELGVPAVGDLRNALVALAGRQGELTGALGHRFESDGQLGGHCLGNLLLTGLWQRHGSLSAAVRAASEMLRAQGTVMPATDARVTLCAEMEDGTFKRGETRISACDGARIRKLWASPADAEPAPGVLDAIAGADTIIFAPGSLYTSVISVLLVNGITEAIAASGATKVSICNLMSQPGETDDLTASEHVRTLESYMGGARVDLCVLNSSALEPRMERAYRESGSRPVFIDDREISRLGTLTITADVLAEHREKVRHSEPKLAGLLAGFMRGAFPRFEALESRVA